MAAQEALISIIMIVSAILIFIMIHDIWSLNLIKLSTRKLLLAVLGVVCCLILFGDMLISTFIGHILEILFTPIIIITGIIFIFIAIIYFGRMIKQF